MRRPSYRVAIEWIALNDETAETDPYVMMDLISVVLIADLFDVAVEIVVQEIMNFRLQRAAA